MLAFLLIVTVIVHLSLLSWFGLLSLLPDVYMKWQKLSEGSCSQVFKPPAVGSHIGSSSAQDELLIPDTELQRIHSLGRKHTQTKMRLLYNYGLQYNI